MKNYKTALLGILLICLLPWKPLMATTETPDYEKEKTIERSLHMGPGQRLEIKNSYGKVRLVNWDRNELKVTVRIKVGEQSEKRAATALDRVEIVESNTEGLIRFETKIASEKESWWSSLSNTGKRSLSIDYEIYLPKSNEINIKNNYGATEIPDRDGKTILSVGYGSLKAGRLMGTNNNISISYSQANINYVEMGTIDVKYSKFELGSTNRLQLSLKYSGGSSIGTVNGSLNTSLSYSDTKITLGKDIQQADIRASYSGVEIRPDAQARFDFNVSTSYGSFDYNKNNTKVDQQSRNSPTSNSYIGSYRGGGNSKVTVKSSYGGITMK